VHGAYFNSESQLPCWYRIDDAPRQVDYNVLLFFAFPYSLRNESMTQETIMALALEMKE
jgi:hypothetical protein